MIRSLLSCCFLLTVVAACQQKSASEGNFSPVGTWEIIGSGSKSPSVSVQSFSDTAFRIEPNGTYDSEGLFGYGTWTYNDSKLSLRFGDKGLATIPQTFQNFKMDFDPNEPIVLERYSDGFRLVQLPKTTRRSWQNIARITRPLRKSVREIMTKFREETGTKRLEN